MPDRPRPTRPLPEGVDLEAVDPPRSRHPSRDRRRLPSRRPDDERAVLDELAGLLDRVHGSEPGNLVVRVGGDLPPGRHPLGAGRGWHEVDLDAEVELGLLRLHDRHPLEALLGWVAPPGCHAVGVRATGRARPLDPGPGQPAHRETAEPVAFTLLVGRSGAEASRLRRGGHVEAMPPPIEGLVADACRRALCLETPPPERSTAHLLTAVWLDRLLAAAALGEPVPTWAAAAAAHPVFDGEPAAPTPHPRGLGHAALAAGRRLTWSRVRAQPWLTGLGDAAPSTRLSSWMDDGAFARWVLAGLPAVPDLLADLGALVPTGVADAVATTVGVTEAAPLSGAGSPGTQ